jgi:hypothetical protein
VFDKLRASPGKVFGGLYPVNVDVDTGRLAGSQITMGALGDSFYEYEMKMWLYSGEPRFRAMYEESADAIAKHLYTESTPKKLGYLREHNGRPIDKMDHLACFAGGMFALGAHGASRKRDLDIGAGIAHTCYEM